MMKINFGSNSKKIDGFVNVDALDLDGVDVVHDCNFFPYPFENGCANEIIAIEFLEHMSMENGFKFLKECHRILKFGGEIKIQVPACDKMMEFYVDKKISDLVPHKPTDKITGDDILKIQQTTGKMVNPLRFEFAFNGAQKHKFDYHLNFFTKEKLTGYLRNAGFILVNVEYDKFNWKLIAKAKK